MKQKTWIEASISLVRAAVAMNDGFYSAPPRRLRSHAAQLAMPERVEEGAGRRTAPARPKGKPVLKDVSTVRVEPVPG